MGIEDRIAKRDKAVQEITRLIRRFLERETPRLLEDLRSLDMETAVNAAEVAGILGGLRSALDEAGLREILETADGIYIQELNSIREAFKEASFRGQLFGAADADVIRELIEIDLSKTSTLIDEYVGSIRSLVMRQIITGQSPDFEWVRKIEQETGDKISHRLETEMNTSLAAFNRTVTISKAVEVGFELFQYQGPKDDEVIRDFCQETMDGSPGAIYTLEEILAMDNGQGLDVLTHGGGWNCRHQWSAISAERAKEEYGYEA